MSSSKQADERIVRSGAYPELTLPAVLVGYLLGSIITISIGYAALILGFSIEGNELAAILGFGILRGVMRRTSIVENNINQTIATSMNCASPGMVFTIPALMILGFTDFNPFLTTLGCMAGGILGIAFNIPLRKQMIEFNRLPFPGGIAVATVLKSPGAGIRKAKLLVGGVAVSALLHLFVYHLGHTENLEIGRWIHMPAYMNGVWYVSLLTIGTGYLAGRGGIYFVIGGYTCYWVLAPLLNLQGLIPTGEALAGQDVADYLRITLFRPVGIGMLIGGAFTGIVLALPLMIGAIRSMQSAARMKASHSRDEMPIRMLYLAVVGAFIVLMIIAINSTPEIGLVRGALMAVVGTLWIWAAGVILAECIGRTNWSPLSGMTLIGVTILLVIVSGIGDRAAIVSSVMVGAAMCVAMAQATDLMLDLKAGHLVGAVPRRQQTAQFLGSWIGPIIIMALLIVLHKAKGLGSEALPAPQAQALASTISGILGGDVPAQKYAAGAVLGGMLSASGIGGLGVLVGLGFYLPFNIVLTYTIGSVTRIVTDKRFGIAFAEDVGIPVAAGMIVGEALVGVAFAVAAVLGA